MFEYASTHDQEFASSFDRLIKNSAGIFASEKQQKFLTKVSEKISVDGKASMLKYYGINVEVGQYVFQINAMARWSDYGSNGNRPIKWFIIMDECGIVAKYKLKYQGSLRDGTRPDPAKTVTVWSREDLVCPVSFNVIEQPKTLNDQKFIGVVGTRVIIKGRIVSVKQFEKRQFHYYDTTIGHITKIIVDGNEVIYFGKLDAEVGDDVTLTVTIKKHDVRDHVKQTIVNRPKLKT